MLFKTELPVGHLPLSLGYIMITWYQEYTLASIV